MNVDEALFVAKGILADKGVRKTGNQLFFWKKVRKTFSGFWRSVVRRNK